MAYLASGYQPGRGKYGLTHESGGGLPYQQRPRRRLLRRDRLHSRRAEHQSADVRAWIRHAGPFRKSTVYDRAQGRENETGGRD